MEILAVAAAAVLHFDFALVENGCFAVVVAVAAAAVVDELGFG